MEQFRQFILVNRPLPIPQYIAQCIADALNKPINDPENLIAGSTKVRMDLNPDGSYRSSKKHFYVQDRAGVFYQITVEVYTK